jgi:hypothetical protein
MSQMCQSIPFFESVKPLQWIWTLVCPCAFVIRWHTNKHIVLDGANETKGTYSSIRAG